MLDFGKPSWGVTYVPCVTNLRALYAWVIRWQVIAMLSLAAHWHGRRALSNHVCAHSAISMWHKMCLQHPARACNEQSNSTSVLPMNHVIQMPQCLSGFVNHDYSKLRLWKWTSKRIFKCLLHTLHGESIKMSLIFLIPSPSSRECNGHR